MAQLRDSQSTDHPETAENLGPGATTTPRRRALVPVPSTAPSPDSTPLQQVEASIRRMMVPASRKHAAAALAALRLAKPLRDLDAEQAKIFFGDFLDDIEAARLTEDDLVVLCRAWRMSGERFFPSSLGVMFDVARTRGTLFPQRLALARARKLRKELLEQAEEIPPERRVPVEKIAALRERLEQATNTRRARREPQRLEPERPASEHPELAPAKLTPLPEGGIKPSPELLRLMVKKGLLSPEQAGFVPPSKSEPAAAQSAPGEANPFQ